jgi:hypothetical protein
MRLYLEYKSVRVTRYSYTYNPFSTYGAEPDLNQGVVVSVIVLNVLLSAVIEENVKAEKALINKPNLE